MKTLIIIVDPNGAGKSTTSAAYLEQFGITPFDFDKEYSKWAQLNFDPLVKALSAEFLMNEFFKGTSHDQCQTSTSEIFIPKAFANVSNVSKVTSTCPSSILMSLLMAMPVLSSMANNEIALLARSVVMWLPNFFKYLALEIIMPCE